MFSLKSIVYLLVLVFIMIIVLFVGCNSKKDIEVCLVCEIFCNEFFVVENLVLVF